MAIDTLSSLHPKFSLPVYTKITYERRNDYEVGNIYEIRVEDTDRADKPPYNYIHEAILISKRKIDIGDISDILLAFDTLTRSRDEAIDKLPDKEDMILLIFLRIDMAKRMVMKGYEGLETEMLKDMMETEQ